MDTLTRDDLKYLAETENGWHVSLFMPAYAAGIDAAQNPIRLHNLLREAENRLMALGMRAAEVRDLLAPALRLLKDTAFWQSQAGGLAVYLAYEQYRVYRVPIALDERVVVSHRFAVSPLLPLLDSAVRYYVLALDQQGAQLYSCTPYTCQPVDLPGAPQGLEETLRFDSLERREHSYAVATGGGHGTSMYYGVGSRPDETKTQLERYCRTVDRAVQARLSGEQAPLVLAGVDSLLTIYREISGYPHVTPRSIVGAVKGSLPANIHAQSWPLVEPVFRQAGDKAMARYQRLRGTGLAAQDLSDIVPAAAIGRVDTLFLARGSEQWGRYEPVLQQVTLHDSRDSDDIDLVEMVAVQTMLHDGALFVVPPDHLPDGVPIAAIYRY
ncbi:MAG: hypothetical protein KIS91_12120 [Anaerolineae bacterium]|nr:hypothetical protein [Anaerolineae bacterium]